MQIIQRKVRGAEAEKDNLLPKFMALRIWSGCSSLFFTLNPHDIRSPITMSLLQDDLQLDKKFSLDLTDEETEAYLADFLKQNPRRLHEAVASNQLAATRCFHWTVRLVIRTLFNCNDRAGSSMDSIAAHETPGIFGHVRAFLGVVEPQMRKALHLHMLIQLVGFSHPEDLFKDNIVPDLFKRLWYFVASISFRSTEAFADYLHVEEAVQALQAEPLLPLTKKQRGMIGAERTQESMRAQLQSRGLQEMPAIVSAPSTVSYTVSTIHSTPVVDARDWSRRAVRAVAASTRKTGNHVCRPDVCYKGSIGKKGFCRMGFWHWCQFTNNKGTQVAQRSHGLPLQPRWNGTGAPPVSKHPPLTGAPALETTHPFHFKMTPSALLGPACNHDLGVLLRIGAAHDGTCTQKEASAGMLDAMGDHEHYCAAYSSKDQPHVEGLLATLADGVLAKQKDILAAKEAGTEFSAHEVSRQLLHRMMSATNRRMHKGFPEMLTYLLRKPMEYCSHEFVSMGIKKPFRSLIAVAHKYTGSDIPSLHKESEADSGPSLCSYFRRECQRSSRFVGSWCRRCTKARRYTQTAERECY